MKGTAVDRYWNAKTKLLIFFGMAMAFAELLTCIGAFFLIVLLLVLLSH